MLNKGLGIAEIDKLATIVRKRNGPFVPQECVHKWTLNYLSFHCLETDIERHIFGIFVNASEN